MICVRRDGRHPDKSDLAEGVSTFVPKGQYLAQKKSQLSLIQNAFANAFQAYDEGASDTRASTMTPQNY
jgi:hypothetical protein